jgi:1-acyl-sn-glycerol-3-phosphate acyltransferase
LGWRSCRCAAFDRFFLTQFLGAFNDNVYRNALVGLLAFQMVSLDGAGFGTASWINVAAALFILPFFLFSAIAGQLADKHDKAILMRRIKLAEILIMLFGGAAVVLASLPLLLTAIFLMGTQSAFFGPAKYGILPMQLHSDELTGGNALVQSGTMIAILLGTIAGGLLINIPDSGRWMVAIGVVAFSTLGWLTSRGIPSAPPLTPSLQIDLNVFSSTWRILRSVNDNRIILLSVMGISWFWFVGSVLLTQLPVYVRQDLRAGQPIATLLLATFTVGIVVGSMLCERFSGRRVEIGLVPLGALGMTIFATQFALIDIPADLLGADFAAFVANGTGRSIVIQLFLLAISAGLYIVPLYALIQVRCDRAYISRVFAFNNVVNALFMVAASVVAVVMLQAGLTIPQLILVVTAMHVAVVVFVFFEVPEFAMRLVVWVITHSLYRVRADGMDQVPSSGAAVVVCNHVSLIDPLIIFAKCRRPIRFVMYYKIYNIPVLNYLFRAAGAIPIASRKEDPALLDKAYDEIAKTLERRELIGIFPEGQLTTDGAIGEFKAGIERIVQATPVPIIPLALAGLWGTFFTRFEGKAVMSRWPRHWLCRVQLLAGPPIDPELASAEEIGKRVRVLYEQASGKL